MTSRLGSKKKERLLPRDGLHTARSEMCQDSSKYFRDELKSSNNKYALLYDFAPVGYFTLGPEGRILSVNLTGTDLLGLERSELIGNCFKNFVAVDDGLIFEEFLGSVFSCHEKRTCRLGLIRGDKALLYVRIEAMTTEAGEECLAVLVDITEKKMAERALFESEYNLTKAQSMTRVGSWSFNTVTSEIQASDELLRIMRLSYDDIDHEAFARVVHPDDFESVMAHLRLGTEEGKSYEIEHRLLFCDGTMRWVYTIVEPHLDNSGKVIKLYGTTQDITERKQAEVELQNKTSELQAIFDSIGDGITVYDHEGKIQHFNQIVARMFPDEIVAGRHCSGIFHPDAHYKPEECPVERALRGERVETTMVCVQNQQRTLYLDVTATPITDFIGQRHRALVFYRDISEKRLQEMRLIQAEKMSSIGVLATGIAHEINNPLTSVAGCAEALQRRFRDEPALAGDSRLSIFPHYLHMIERESYRCKGIIDHLLSFGRHSDGLAINVDLNALLLEILELISHQSTHRQIKVVKRMQDGLPCIKGDPSLLRQLCMNLLINAHQSITGKGLVELTTSVAEGNMISINIRDNGCGIPREHLDRIWDPFFTTKDVGKGVGLGLALTYNIVKRHGGEIQVTSTVDEGTTFTVLLPL